MKRKGMLTLNEQTKYDIDLVNEEIINCPFCNQIEHIGQLVVGEGNRKARIIFVGEAPGKQESKTGKPFIGPAGKLLDMMLRDILMINREDVFITSVVKYLPPYITPKDKDILHGMTHLNKQIAAINPEIIVLMGKTATKGYMGIMTESITAMANQMYDVEGQNVFVTLHPASALRSGKYRELFVNNFQTLKTKLGF